LLNDYLGQFFVKAHFTDDEFAHWFSPREGVVQSFVICDSDNKVTDFVSFYSLPSSILNNPTYNTLNAAYSYYNVARTVPLTALVNDALIFAQQQGFDVFNCLDVMQNEEFLKPLKFGRGDGYLQYYLYNWKCPDMPANKMGLVLL
jgi:glycylpeptide N-tetradecanoyltransferase